MFPIYMLLVLVVAVLAFVAGRRRGKALAASGAHIHSLPTYHGLFTASAALIPMLALLVVWGIVRAAASPSTSPSPRLPADLQPADDMARGT